MTRFWKRVAAACVPVTVSAKAGRASHPPSNNERQVILLAEA